MTYFVEIQFFDAEALHDGVRRKMRAASAGFTQWIEWTPTLNQGCEKPDLTLISAQYLGWREVALHANAANGRHIVLLDDCKFTLGLPALPLDFAMEDLWSLAHKGKGKQISRQALVLPSFSGIYEPPSFRSTIPRA